MIEVMLVISTIAQALLPLILVLAVMVLFGIWKKLPTACRACGSTIAVNSYEGQIKVKKCSNCRQVVK